MIKESWKNFVSFAYHELEYKSIFFLSAKASCVWILWFRDAELAAAVG